MSSVRDRILEKASRARIPVMCSFELLPVCNLKCKMCYVRKTADDVRRGGGLKDADWWLCLAREAAAEGLLYPLLTGGEPFLHPQFREILAGMLDMGLQVSINTNGTMIDRECAEFLSKHRPTRINLTLYGMSEETYRNLCGNGEAFHRVMQAVSLLKEYDIPLKFNASITPDNVDELEAIIAYAKEQECPVQVATYMFPPLRRDSSLVGQNERLTPEQAAFAKVKVDFLQSDPGWFVTQASRYQRFGPLSQKPWEMGAPAERGMRCRAGLSSLWVDWQGNFINCGMYGSVKVVPEGLTFRQAWDKLVQETAAVRYSPACLSCPNEPLCHPCIAMIANECGSHSGRPEYMCRMHEAMSQYYDQFVREHYPEMLPSFVIPQDPTDTCEI